MLAPARDGQRKLPLIVLTGCPDDVRVMQQDLYGPVLPLVAAESLDAAIAYVNGVRIRSRSTCSQILARNNSRRSSPHWPAASA